jgi:transposase
MEKIRNVEDVPSVEEVILGVDTHLDLHVAVALDQLGRRLGEITVPTSTRGYARLLRWAEGFGIVGCVGIEGTSSYGAGLVRYLRSAEIPVVEVERPKRRHLRRKGKSDPIDAEAAARAVLAGEAAGEPKSGDGQVGMIRTLRSTRQSAVKARSQAANQLQAMLVTAPEELRRTLRELPTKALVATCARLRPVKEPDDVRTATKIALRSVARRHEALSEEIAELDERLDRLVVRTSPGLISLPAIGTHHAATLLCVAGTIHGVWPAKPPSPASAESLP